MSIVTKKIEDRKSQIEDRKSQIANPLRIIDCGLAGYEDVLDLQLRLHEQRRGGEIPNTVLIVEHQPVITLGARQSANILLVDSDCLADKGIQLVNTRRGGGVTAHNPGQLVFYPVLDLYQLRLGISEYVRKLEAIGARLLAQLGVDAHRQKGLPGLWVGNRKIASIGVRVSKFTTYHGMAINIQNDLGIFDLFVPCGLAKVEMTSVLKETGRRHSMSRAKEKLSQLLIDYFSKEKPENCSVAVGTSAIVRDTRYATRNTRRLPPWLRRPLPAGDTYAHTSSILNDLGLQTICINANCPNRGQCWAMGTATVLILGNVCTRNCGFCSVATGKPKPPDTAEPQKLALMARRLSLKYLVITSVDRDDLPDGGAGHFRDCVSEVRRHCPDIQFEILTPDFRHCQSRALDILSEALPFTFAHNLETVPSLYSLTRSGGDYKTSLRLLETAKEKYNAASTKSSIMLGLGENDTEVLQVLRDLRRVGCDRITIGQYLKPSRHSLDVVEYITPERFQWWNQQARKLGFPWIISSPFARSSYFAHLQNTQTAGQTFD